MPNVIQEEFNVVYALGIVKLVQIRKKSMRLGMLVGIGNSFESIKVFVVSWVKGQGKSRSGPKIRLKFKFVQNMSSLVSN